MSRPHTDDECREKLIQHLNAVRNHWLGEAKTPEEAVDGMVFSFLSMIDGESGTMPAFALTPSPHPNDAEHREGKGENYWPSDVNLGGELHHQWANRAEASAQTT